MAAPLRVLIVEDNPSDAKLLERELRRGEVEFEATRVETEPDYLVALDGEPDVVLCDWGLPQFDTLRALALLKERRPGTPFILVSGSIGEEAAVNVIKLGASDYLLKDRLGRLVPAIQKAIAERETEGAARRAEASLRQSEAQLAEAQRTARLGCWVWEPATGSVRCSETMYSLFGLSVNSLRPSLEAFAGLIHPDDRAAAVARVEALLAGTADEFANDFRVVRPDGVVVWVHSRGRAVRNTLGQVLRIEGTDQDITERKQAEDVLRFQHALLASQTEASPDGILVVGPDGRVLGQNRRFLDLWGVPEHLIANGDDAPILALAQSRTADPASFAARVAAIYADPDAHSHDEVALADGRVLDRYSSPIRGTDGVVLGRVWYFRDVTDQKRAEAAVRESEERYRRLLAVLPTAVLVHDGDRVLYCNPAFVHLVGAGAADEVLARRPLDCVHPDDRPLARSRLALMQVSGEAAPGTEMRFVRDDGRAVRAHAVTAPIAGYGGPAYLVALSDLSERERAMELLRSVLNSVGDAILTIDGRGTVTSTNPATERLFGYSEADLLGRNVSALMPEPHRRGHDRYVADYLRTGVAKVIGTGREVEAQRKDGTTFPAELTVTEFARDGERHFTGVLRDISARRRLEEQYHHAQKMEAVGQLAGGVAHDFNNLLTVINGFTDVLMAEVPATNPSRAHLAAVRDAGERAAGLTAQLLAFSRKTIIAPKVLNLNELVAHLGKMLGRLIGEDVTFVTVLAPGLPRVKADPGQLEQVLMNLAVNARDAMTRGGRLTIETDHIALAPRELPADDLHPGQFVRLRVTDTGCGINPEVLSKIFEPFFTTKATGRGTGLGLATVYGIVKQAGGHISAVSTVGVGTTFVVLLPAVTEEVQPPEAGEKEMAPRGAETVLLVEDEPAVLRLAQTVLETQGYRVITAANGDAGLAASNAHPGTIDLLLTDVVMPGLGGRDLAERIRSYRPEARVLYMSGYTADAIIRYGVGTATDSFLQKPFTPLSLARKVRQVIDQR